jgi:hypothetical protein
VTLPGEHAGAALPPLVDRSFRGIEMIGREVTLLKQPPRGREVCALVYARRRFPHASPHAHRIKAASAGDDEKSPRVCAGAYCSRQVSRGR